MPLRGQNHGQARSPLNLTNEVFGFYNGSPQYVAQREFYKPTYEFGLRWNPSFEK